MKKTTFLIGCIIMISMSVMGLMAITGNLSGHDDHEHDHEHDHSVEIEGSEMRSLTVQEVANLWEIDAEILLSKIIAEVDLKEEYTVNTVLDHMRDEYKFSPAIIKDIAEEIRQDGV